MSKPLSNLHLTNTNSSFLLKSLFHFRLGRKKNHKQTKKTKQNKSLTFKCIHRYYYKTWSHEFLKSNALSKFEAIILISSLLVWACFPVKYIQSLLSYQFCECFHWGEAWTNSPKNTVFPQAHFLWGICWHGDPQKDFLNCNLLQLPKITVMCYKYFFKSPKSLDIWIIILLSSNKKGNR